MGACPWVIAACHTKLVPPKLSWKPFPLSWPGPWSKENVYRGMPFQVTWWVPLESVTDATLPDTAVAAVGLAPLTVSGAQIALQSLVVHIGRPAWSWLLV